MGLTMLQDRWMMGVLRGVEAYNRLSPEFRKRLHGLRALHSGTLVA